MTDNSKKSIAFLKTIFSDYRLYLFILAILKLYHINIEVLDEHHWRQTVTLGIARNFMEWDSTIFLPRTLICDSRTGILPQEFPILNYLIVVCWSIFGQENWVFRMVMILSTTTGLYYFYHFIREVLGRTNAIYSLVLFGTSIAFAYSRKAMPDMFAISLCFGALWFGLFYLKERRIKHLLMYFLLCLFGLLSKMPSAVVMGLILIPFLDKKYQTKAKVNLLAVSAVALSIMGVWYFIWVPHLESTYGFKLFYTKSFSEGFQEIRSIWEETSRRFTRLAFQNPLTFFTCIVGFAMILFKQKWSIVFAVLLSSVVASLFILKTGGVFSTHEYYILPIIPLLVLGGATFFEWLHNESRIIAIGFLSILSIWSVYNQWHHMSVVPESAYLAELKNIVPKHVPSASRILVNTRRGDPTSLFMSHRKGWISEDRYTDKAWVKAEKAVGLDYLVLVKKKIPAESQFELEVIYEDEQFLILKNE